MGYTVFSLTDEDGAQASGLTLPEAFARMMALAQCDYTFGRFQGDMVLTLTPADAPDAFPQEPPPACKSKHLDNFAARAEIMRWFLKHGFGGHRMMTDEDWKREEQRRRTEDGFIPARHIDWE